MAEWQEWAKIDVTKAKAKEVLKSLPNLSDSRAEKLLIQYNREAYERGQSAWALYSALTHYASHNSGNFNLRNTGVDHEAQTMQRREEQVLIWVRSKTWKELVNK